MKKSEYIYIRNTQKAICKGYIIKRLLELGESVETSEDEEIIELEGPMKVPTEIPDKIAQQLLKKGKAYKFS